MNFNQQDVVHSNLTLPYYVQEFIETKHFQRLKNIKQLGVTNVIFKTATSGRAQHCIGTAYLCKCLLDTLEKNSKFKIDELHKKCVVLAGLLHDIGHGPFSHLWEGVVREGKYKTWTHEQQSIEMINHMVTSYNIKLDNSPENHEYALKLIFSLIAGDAKSWTQLLKPQEIFLTEIVSNKFCNVDVDKCDYLLRDTHYVRSMVEVKPFIEFLTRAKIVYDDDGTSHIGYHENDFHLIENMFFNRAYFHNNIYQHYKVVGVEKMVRDILVKCDAGGFMLSDHRLSEVQSDPSKYLSLDDSVLEQIKDSNLDNQLMNDGKKIYENLTKGKLYTMVWENLDEDKTIFKALIDKFGTIFCEVRKLIPSAEVPLNIPLYNDQGTRTSKKSNLKLSFKSTLIYCVDADDVTVNNVKNFLNSLNNNM
ncbi:CLUMA_CG013381, isoform A [Clunio marinus]|uniref:CLUMA_CG013381, isoform A n=1 Tax=Clunio marinus TaxID=568069 RepID=A0A1J1IKN1_9DIPT|nr:CLUMA_CG013381, isoform A [Clunio marinus]